MKVRRYTVDICDACYNLQPSECHTPGCIFFLCLMPEVAAFMERALIRPVVEGERFRLQEDAELVGDEG